MRKANCWEDVYLYVSFAVLTVLICGMMVCAIVLSATRGPYGNEWYASTETLIYLAVGILWDMFLLWGLRKD